MKALVSVEFILKYDNVLVKGLQSAENVKPFRNDV